MKRLGTRLALLILPVMLAGTAGLVGIITANESVRLVRYLTREAKSYADGYSIAAGQRLATAMDVADTLAVVLARSGSRIPERGKAGEYLRDALEGFPEFAAVWSVWEPDAFDAADASNKDAEGSGTDGRFTPLWHAARGLIELSGPWELDPGGAEAYGIAKNLSEPVLVEPRPITYAAELGATPDIVSLVVPILQDGLFLGAVGVDTPLSKLASYVTAQKPAGSGYAFLLGNSGRMLIHPNSAFAGKPFSEIAGAVDKSFGVSAAVGRGAALDFKAPSLVSNRSAMFVIARMTVGKCRRPWSLGVEIPLDDLFAEIAKAQFLFIALGAAVVLMTAVTVFLFARAAVRPVSLTADAIRDIAEGEGDLTRSLDVHRADEVGALAESFNRFTESLRVSILRVQDSTATLAGTGSDLSADMDRTAVAVENILGSIRRTKEGAVGQAAGATESASAIGAVAANIESLESLVEEQSAAATESSAAIEQAIAAVRSMVKTMETLSGRYAALIAAGEEGRTRQDAVNERIVAVASQSERLMEANQILSAIADQTNILAMNAAIEAAHAGEMGKGFAVVADEIRRLAENSTERTRAVSQDLESIRESIDAIVLAGKEAGESFDTISSLIADVEELVTGARGALLEQDQGSTRILEALGQMTGIAARVRDAAAEMRSGAVASLDEMERLAEASRRILAEMEDTATQAAGIEQAVERVRTLVAKTMEAIGAVREETDRFKCGDHRA
ncbi:MAG: methyl-accepting chemotaxis protein [Spirochaetes bacterium]|nr:methyl-accepting chemotaxis protein [Spirochaetota bacterium]